MSDGTRIQALLALVSDRTHALEVTFARPSAGRP